MEKSTFSRRGFLKFSGICAAALLFPGSVKLNAAFPSTNTYPKIVVNILLDGGPDFRFLFVPKPLSSDSYSLAFWKARNSMYDTSSIANYSSMSDLQKYQAIYNTNYEDVTLSSLTFGILKTCAWLKTQMQSSNVAVINNVVASTNRDHSHSMMILESGDLTLGSHDAGANGWLGRAAANTGENVVSFTKNVRMVCNGPHPSGLATKHKNDNVISAPDTRNIAFYDHETAQLMAANDNSWKGDSRKKIARALESYYKAKASSVSSNSLYKKFYDHESNIRSFGFQVKAVLNDTDIPIPNPFNKSSSSYIGVDNSSIGSSDRFVKQMAGLYDSYACRNIFNMGYASMDYRGWDSHKVQQTFIGPKLEYLFGAGKNFDTLYTELTKAVSTSLDNTVFVISGEFGRQLKANGSDGTDHGRGNSVLVIGKPVNGGLYGELFPTSEITPNAQTGKTLFETSNSDIEGKTSMIRVFSQVLDWKSSGLGTTALGNLTSHKLESGVDLTTLFA